MKQVPVILITAALLCACSDDASKRRNNEAEPDAAVNNAADTDTPGDANGTADMGGADVPPNNATPDMDEPGEPTDFALGVPCVDGLDDVYATAISAGEPGEVLACAASEEATLAEVQLRLTGISGLQLDTGYRSYLIAYRTTRTSGEPGVATMHLYVPQENVRAVARSGLVVANHLNAAVPDECAPSRGSQALAATNSYALPWVARGYPVALPDYAGFGTAGVMGFANVHDLGQSSLDAARAARNAFEAGTLNGRVLSVGQGEGATAAYAMQALNAEYAPDVQLEGAIGFATSYPRLSYAELLRLGGVFPLVDGVGVTRAIAALVAYTDFYNLFGAARARDAFEANLRDYVGDAVESSCFVELAATLATATAEYTPPANIGQLIDGAFRMDVVDCLNGNACGADAQAFVDRAGANVKPLDPAGGDLLFISAFGGTRPDPNEQACLLEWIGENGPAPTGCLWSGVNNVNLSRQAVEWGVATLEGDAAPACPESDFPPCN